jgi:hypothetical protein
MTYLADAQQAIESDKRKLLKSLNNIKAVEISFEEHEIYDGDKLIAKIIHDNGDFVTQPWLVIINGVEIHQANTWAKCYHYTTWHFKQGTLPTQQQVETASVDCRHITLPVFISKQRQKPQSRGQKARQIAFILLVLRIYAKCFKVLAHTAESRRHRIAILKERRRIKVFSCLGMKFFIVTAFSSP